MSKDKSIDNHKKHIDNFFKGYLQEQFSAKDYRLMNWVYRTKELRNEELKELSISKQNSYEDISFEEIKIKESNEDQVDNADSKSNLDLSNKIHNIVTKDNFAQNTTSFNTPLSIFKEGIGVEKMFNPQNSIESSSVEGELNIFPASIPYSNINHNSFKDANT